MAYNRSHYGGWSCTKTPQWVATISRGEGVVDDAVQVVFDALVDVLALAVCLWMVSRGCRAA